MKIGNVSTIIGVLVAFIVVMELLSGFATPLATAAAAIAGANATYGGLYVLFSAGGVLFLVLLGGIFYGFYKQVWKA